MNPFEILITKENYDEDDKLQIETIFGPKLVFAYDKEGAVRKALIDSGLPSSDIGGVYIWVKEYTSV